MVLVNEMIRVQRGDEEVTAQKAILEQQADAEARAREERTVEQFLETQARYETDLSHQARAAVQQHALEEKAYYEARFHHLEANLQHRQALHNHNLEEKAIMLNPDDCTNNWRNQSSTAVQQYNEKLRAMLPTYNRNCNTI